MSECPNASDGAHQTALYPANPITGKKMDGYGVRQYGANYQNAVFCMLCGERQDAETNATKAEAEAPPVHSEG